MMTLDRPIQMKVLAVDDEKDTLQFLKDLLVHAGFRVTTAANAIEALIHVRMDPPDVILLDIMMPGMDGHELAQSLVSSWDTFDIPIIVLSCRRDVASKAWGKINGCICYLERPASPEEIIGAVQKAARQRRTHHRFRAR